MKKIILTIALLCCAPLLHAAEAFIPNVEPAEAGKQIALSYIDAHQQVAFNQLLNRVEHPVVVGTDLYFMMMELQPKDGGTQVEVYVVRNGVRLAELDNDATTLATANQLPEMVKVRMEREAQLRRRK